MDQDRFVPIGRIVKAHGLKGEVSVLPLTGLPFELPEGLRVWVVPPPSGVREGVVEAVRRGPKGPLVKISGVEGIEAARSLAGRELVALADDLPAGWAEEEPDPVGLGVLLEDGSELGSVTGVIATGANDVWVVHGPRGELLLPVIPEVVLDVDEDARRALVRPLPGLIDEG
ncbi:MAG: 16S rRNA processing protein RimM [Coriobacteriia bacterium]|nr:16S rRNA processing protein RimM [Coriobacteriia bacterium]